MRNHGRDAHKTLFHSARDMREDLSVSTLYDTVISRIKRARTSALDAAKRGGAYWAPGEIAHVHPSDAILENMWLHLHRFVEETDEKTNTVRYYKWSDNQELAFLDYMGAVAPSLYGDDWITNATRVCMMWGWERISLYQLKRWSRRTGKTYSTVAFVAAYLMTTADDMGVGIYSQGARASTEFMTQVHDFVRCSAFYTEGRIISYTKGGHTPMIAIQSLLAPNVIVCAYAYPSSEVARTGAHAALWGSILRAFFATPSSHRGRTHKCILLPSRRVCAHTPRMHPKQYPPSGNTAWFRDPPFAG